MELLFYIVGILRKMAWTHPATGNKLQKKRRDKKVKEYYSREMLDVVRKSTLGLCSQSHEALGLIMTHLASPEPPILDHRPSNISEASTSQYSIDLMLHQQNLRRTRPKTPILRVGQREAMAEQAKRVDSTACMLAEHYQALLPPHSPSQLFTNLQPATRRLRKVKSQTSLRDLSRDQADLAEGKTSLSDLDGDLDTLVGSEPASPDTNHHHFWRSPSFEMKPSCANCCSSRKNEKLIKDDSDIGLQICVDLLTNELASILFRHHPVEENDRASELQILLMIEAYETIQKQIHEKRMDPKVTINHVKQVEQLLENWLDVLYDLYDRSQKIKSDTIEYVEADYWAPLDLHIPNANLRA